MTTQGLEQRLSTLPERSIVYYLLFYQDADGLNLHPLEYLDRLSAITNRPIYSWIDSTMNHGVVGGTLLSINLQIEVVTNLALDVLRGGRADAIPVVTRDLSVDQVDMRQVDRWSISRSRIPPGTALMFRDASPWEQYKVYILASAAFLVLETILIAALLIQISRRRRVETRISGSEAELRTSYDRIRDLGGRLIGAQEAERSRIARELHDDVSQEVALLTMHLNVASSATRKGRRDAEIFVNEALERTHRIANTLHNMSHRLHPAGLRLIGLVPSIHGLLRELRKSHTDIAISFTHEKPPDTIDPDAALCMFRITQEALQNAIKHSGADRIDVHFAGDRTHLRMTFTDNGVGFDVRAVERRGIGLISINERLEPFGGTLTIRSTIGTGTCLDVILPLGIPARD
jgi:signal transduction histidine kinase